MYTVPIMYTHSEVNGMNYLTQKEVQSKIRNARKELAETGKPAKMLGLKGGLILKVTASTLNYQARVKVGGKYTTAVIGPCDKITLSDAYRQAKVLADRAETIREERMKSPLFRDFWREYRDTTDKALNLSKVRICNKNAFYNTVLHVLDDLHLDEITPQVVSERVKSVSTSQNNMHNALSTLVSCFVYALNKGRIATNPIASLTRLPEFRRDRAAVKGYRWVEVDELREVLFTPLEGYPVMFQVYVLLVALTASRKGEMLRLRWEQVDFCATGECPHGLITIPNSETKTRRDTGRGDHVIPLTIQLRNLLGHYRTLSECLGSPYLFPGRDPQAPRAASVMMLPKNISARMDLHGLRKTANTFLCSQRFDRNWNRDDIDRILSHKVDTIIHETYDKYDYTKELYTILSFYDQYLQDNCLTPAFLKLVE